MSTQLRGLNLANLSDQIIYYGNFGNKRPRPCVFLSHKREDKPACKILARHLSENHIDYYLDEEDPYLQAANLQKDPFKMTEAIKNGIKNSTHMAVIISEKTYKSEWVPFEVGYGHAAIVDKGMVANQRAPSINLAVIILKDLKGKILPDYLQVGYQIKSIADFIQYTARLKGNQLGIEILSYIVQREESNNWPESLRSILF